MKIWDVQCLHPRHLVFWLIAFLLVFSFVYFFKALFCPVTKSVFVSGCAFLEVCARTYSNREFVSTSKVFRGAREGKKIGQHWPWSNYRKFSRKNEGKLSSLLPPYPGSYSNNNFKERKTLVWTDYRERRTRGLTKKMAKTMAGRNPWKWKAAIASDFNAYTCTFNWKAESSCAFYPTFKKVRMIYDWICT